MNPARAEHRILAALLLAPMDSGQLSRVLSLRLAYVQRRVIDLRRDGSLGMHGYACHRTGRPSLRYALTRKGRASAQRIFGLRQPNAPRPHSAQETSA